MSGWIPCSERLPEIAPATIGSDDVLIYLPEPGACDVAYLYESLDRGWRWDLGDDDIPVGAASHWMPLPAPPGSGIPDE